MTLQEYRTTFSDEDSPGWLAIDKACAKLYGAGDPLGHFAPSLSPMLGGTGPDGVSIYRSVHHLHYISYGFSSLHYNEEAAGQEFSGRGMELTFRLRSNVTTRDDLPLWPVSIFQNLYRYVGEKDTWFEPNQAIPTTAGPINADLSIDQSVITGLMCAEDSELGAIDTPHGQVQFILLTGMTLSEAEQFTAGNLDVAATLDELRKSDPLLVTDMTRGLPTAK